VVEAPSGKALARVTLQFTPQRVDARALGHTSAYEPPPLPAPGFR